MTTLAPSRNGPVLADWAARSTRSLLLRTGIGRAHFRKQRALRVICYHGVCADDVVGEPWVPDYFVSASQFAEQIAFLKALAPVVSLPEAVESIDSGGEATESRVAITFDDVAACSFAHAVPVLEEHGVRAAFFVSTGHAESGRLFDADVIALGRLHAAHTGFPESPAIRQFLEHPALHKRMPVEDVAAALADLEAWLRGQVDAEVVGALRAMNWDEIGRVAEMGHTIGPHTVDHAILGWQQARTRRTQVVESIDEVAQRTHCRPDCFAYPNGGPGDFDERDQRVLRHTGIRYAFSTRAGFCTADADLLALPRVCIGKYHTMDKFAMEVSGLLDRRRRRQQGWN